MAPLSTSAANPSAGASNHGWFVAEALSINANESARLYHLPGLADPGVVRMAQPLTMLPDHLAAWGNHVYLLYEQRESTDPASPITNRSVRTVSVNDAPVPGWYTFEPSDRQAVLPSLTSEGLLVGFVGTAGGPVALIKDADTNEPSHTLLRLERGQWRPLALPPKSITKNNLQLISHNNTFALLARSPDAPSDLWVRYETHIESKNKSEHAIADPGNLWTHQSLPPISDDENLYTFGASTIAISRSVDGVMSISSLRSNRRYQMASIPSIPEEHWVVPIGDVLTMIWAEPDGQTKRLHAVVVSAISGRLLFGPAPTPREPLIREQDLQFLGMLLAAVMLIIMIFILRPAAAARTAVNLPEDTSLADPMRRVLAFVIDYLPSALAASIIFRTTVASVVGAPFSHAGSDQMWPFIASLGIVLLHSTLSEWLAGRTLGKLIMRCRTISVTGGRPSAWQAMSRNIVKVLAPPIMLIVFIDPRRRHPGDHISGTVVIRDHADESAGPDQPVD